MNIILNNTIAAVGFMAVLPFTLYWIVRAWLAGGDER